LNAEPRNSPAPPFGAVWLFRVAFYESFHFFCRISNALNDVLALWFSNALSLAFFGFEAPGIRDFLCALSPQKGFRFSAPPCTLFLPGSSRLISAPDVQIEGPCVVIFWDFFFVRRSSGDEPSVF